MVYLSICQSVLLLLNLKLGRHLFKFTLILLSLTGRGQFHKIECVIFVLSHYVTMSFPLKILKLRSISDLRIFVKTITDLSTIGCVFLFFFYIPTSSSSYKFVLKVLDNNNSIWNSVSVKVYTPKSTQLCMYMI